MSPTLTRCPVCDGRGNDPHATISLPCPYCSGARAVLVWPDGRVTVAAVEKPVERSDFAVVHPDSVTVDRCLDVLAHWPDLPVLPDEMDRGEVPMFLALAAGLIGDTNDYNAADFYVPELE